MSEPTKLRRFSLRAFGWGFLALCVTLVSGCCRRNVMKYGGPPDVYKQVKIDSTTAQQDTLKK
jgi:hypothetical protein